MKYICWVTYILYTVIVNGYKNQAQYRKKNCKFIKWQKKLKGLRKPSKAIRETRSKLPIFSSRQYFPIITNEISNYPFFNPTFFSSSLKDHKCLILLFYILLGHKYELL